MEYDEEAITQLIKETVSFLETNNEVKEFQAKNFHKSDKAPKGSRILIIDCIKFIQQSQQSYDYLVDNPKEIQPFFEKAWTQSDKSQMSIPYFELINLSPTEEKNVNEINKNDLNKLMTINCMVISKSPILVKFTKTRFECPSCGQVFIVEQQDDFFHEPQICACGRKGKFRELDSEKTNHLNIIIEPLPEQIQKEEPQQVVCIIRGEILKQKKDLVIGSRIKIVGYFVTQSKYVMRRKSSIAEYRFLVNSFRNTDYIDFDTKITEKEQELFNFIKNSENPAKVIADFIFEDIEGYDLIKEALVVQQFSGGMINGKRNYIHLLMYGNPSTAKTDLARTAASLNIINGFSGKNSSGVGLTVSLTQNKDTGRPIISAGLLPKCSGGCVVVDEINRLDKEIQEHLLHPMENGVIPLNKWGMSSTVRCWTSLVGTANFVEGMSKEHNQVVENLLKMDSALLNRFDLVFEMDDTVFPEKDKKIAEKILQRRQFSEKISSNPEKETSSTHNNPHKNILFYYNNNIYNIESLKKYVYFCKNRNVQYPKPSKRLHDTVSIWYFSIRKALEGREGGLKVNPRTLESVLRFACAIAFMKQKNTIQIPDFKLALKYFNYIYNVDFIDGVVKVKDGYKSSSEIVQTFEDQIVGALEVAQEKSVEDLCNILDCDEKDLKSYIDVLIRKGVIVETSPKKYLRV